MKASEALRKDLFDGKHPSTDWCLQYYNQRFKYVDYYNSWINDDLNNGLSVEQVAQRLEDIGE